MRAWRDPLDPRAPFCALMDGGEWREVVQAAKRIVSRRIKAALDRLSISSWGTNRLALTLGLDPAPLTKDRGDKQHVLCSAAIPAISMALLSAHQWIPTDITNLHKGRCRIPMSQGRNKCLGTTWAYVGAVR